MRCHEALMNGLNNSSCEDKRLLPKICNMLHNVDFVTKWNASKNGLISKRGQALFALCFAPGKQSQEWMNILKKKKVFLLISHTHTHTHTQSLNCILYVHQITLSHTYKWIIVENSIQTKDFFVESLPFSSTYIFYVPNHHEAVIIILTPFWNAIILIN